MGYDRNVNITRKCKATIDELFREYKKDLGPDYKKWRTWENTRFFQALYLCAQIRSDGSELKARTTFDFLRGEIQAWSPDLNTVNAAPHADSRQTLQDIATQSEALDKEAQKKLAQTAVDRLIAVT